MTSLLTFVTMIHGDQRQTHKLHIHPLSLSFTTVLLLLSLVVLLTDMTEEEEAPHST